MNTVNRITVTNDGAHVGSHTNCEMKLDRGDLFILNDKGGVISVYPTLTWTQVVVTNVANHHASRQKTHAETWGM